MRFFGVLDLDMDTKEKGGGGVSVSVFDFWCVKKEKKVVSWAYTDWKIYVRKRREKGKRTKWKRGGYVFARNDD